MQPTWEIFTLVIYIARTIICYEKIWPSNICLYLRNGLFQKKKQKGREGLEDMELPGILKKWW